jgi:hypothetical protein
MCDVKLLIPNRTIQRTIRTLLCCPNKVHQMLVFVNTFMSNIKQIVKKFAQLLFLN